MAKEVELPVPGEVISVWTQQITDGCNNNAHDTRVLIAANNELTLRVLELELQLQSILQVLGQPTTWGD